MKIALELTELTDEQSDRLLTTVQGAVTETITDDVVIERHTAVDTDAVDDLFATLDRLTRNASRAARAVFGTDNDDAGTEPAGSAETYEPDAVRLGRSWLAQRADLTSTPTVPTVRLLDAIDVIEGLIDLHHNQQD